MFAFQVEALSAARAHRVDNEERHHEDGEEAEGNSETEAEQQWQVVFRRFRSEGEQVIDALGFNTDTKWFFKAYCLSKQ